VWFGSRQRTSLSPRHVDELPEVGDLLICGDVFGVVIRLPRRNTEAMLKNLLQKMPSIELLEQTLIEAQIAAVLDKEMLQNPRVSV
jgi:hypothetical protein